MSNVDETLRIADERQLSFVTDRQCFVTERLCFPASARVIRKVVGSSDQVEERDVGV